MKKNDSFYNLDPDTVLQAAEMAGFTPTGEFTQLNSYENRVFDIKLEIPFSESPLDKNIIAKFYRPGRWSKKSILDEHSFIQELKNDGIPAVAPLELDGLSLQTASTLIETKEMYAAFFPKVLGKMPEEFLGDDLKKVGRLMAQVHNVGSRRKAQNRLTLTPEKAGAWDTLDILQRWIAPEVIKRYNQVSDFLLNELSDLAESNQAEDDFIRIHGDCHRGNLLSNGKQFFLVDFDDFCNGPVIQDFWMLLSGDSDLIDQEKEEIISGYEELRDFPDHQWEWIPLYRAMRIIQYSGWIARRWEDPNFPRLFPQFVTYNYWAQEVDMLEKIAFSLEQS